MRQLWGIIDFLRATRTRLRFGKLSRAPLKLIQFHWAGEVVHCGWIARPADDWDKDLSERIQSSKASAQSLEDAMAVRELLFEALPEVKTADLRVFRKRQDGTSELIVAGSVSRDNEPKRDVASLTMRAKLCGLHFLLEDGVLKAWQEEPVATSNS